jgi:hypothetical protein
MYLHISFPGNKFEFEAALSFARCITVSFIKFKLSMDEAGWQRPTYCHFSNYGQIQNIKKIS